MTHLFQQFYKNIVTMAIIFMQVNCNHIYDGSDQGHTSVPTDIPSGMSYIYLKNNNISYINDESFDETYTDFSTVDQLDLDVNQIETVSERAFKGFPSVKTIFMYNNKLEYILFMEEDIPQLEFLYLEDNHLTQIPKFYGFFQSLRILYLTANSISHACGEDFENITNIDTIDLSRNCLITFEPQQELSSLSYLYLYNNELTEMPALKGTYNSIRGIDIGNNNVTVESLLTLRERINGSEQSLTDLFLGGNEDFTNNLSVVINFLKLFPKLRTFGFIGSKINRIFHLTNNVETLYFSENQISQIFKDDFNVSNEYDLFELSLYGNPIQSLPNLYEYLKGFNSMQTVIYLTNIKFHCDNLCWMTERG